MSWKSNVADGKWSGTITNRRQKEKIAKQLALRLRGGDVVGVGSGSTSYLALQALARRRDQEDIKFQAIVTSIEMELTCAALSIPVVSLNSQQPDWSFDGADEIDPKGNMIKGRGGAMLREKILMQASPEVHILADPSKYVRRLGEHCAVPVEVYPEAVNVAASALGKFKETSDIKLRQAIAKDGPVITEAGNLILDVKFSSIVPNLERRLKSIVGVVESGLFMGYKVNFVKAVRA